MNGDNFWRNVNDWFRRTCLQLSRALLIAFIIRALFEISPELQSAFPKMYAVYDWTVSLYEELFKFIFGFFGSLCRGEMAEFYPQVWGGIQELSRAFIALF